MNILHRCRHTEFIISERLIAFDDSISISIVPNHGYKRTRKDSGNWMAGMSNSKAFIPLLWFIKFCKKYLPGGIYTLRGTQMWCSILLLLPLSSGTSGRYLKLASWRHFWLELILKTFCDIQFWLTSCQGADVSIPTKDFEALVPIFFTLTKTRHLDHRHRKLLNLIKLN